MPLKSKKKKEGKLTMQQEKFIAAYIKHAGIVDRACKEIGCHPSSFYRDWQHQEHFKRALEEVEQSWVDMLRASAMKYATKGNAALNIFMLKSLDPEKYDENFRKQRLANEGMLKAAQAMKQPTFIIQSEAPDPEKKLLEDD